MFKTIISQLKSHRDRNPACPESIGDPLGKLEVRSRKSEVTIRSSKLRTCFSIFHFSPSIFHFLFSILVAFSLILTGCKKGPEVYKIGAILPLTGNLAFMGELERNGMKVAEEMINNKGGIKGKKIQIIFGDSKGEAKEAIALANKFIDVDKIKIIISSTTGASYALAPMAAERKFVLSTFCMDPTIQTQSPYVFRLYESMGQEAEAILQYFKNVNIAKKIKGVAILYVHHPGSEQQYRDYFRPGFKNLGIKVLFAEPYEFTQKDFKSQIIKIKNSGANHLVIIGYGFVYPVIFKELKQYGVLEKVKILGGWGFIVPSTTPKEFLEGVIVGVPQYAFSKNEKALEFIRVYETKFGKKPNFDAAFAYENVLLLSSAIEKAGGCFPDKIVHELTILVAYEGIMGEILISKEGDLRVPMGLGIIRNGRVIPLEDK